MRDDEERAISAAFEFAAGTAAIVVAGFAAATLFPPGEPAGRALIMAIVVGVLCALFTAWRACAGIAVVAVLVFVGFLTHRYGTLTGAPAPWSYTPVFGFAVLVGRGYRRLAQVDPLDAELRELLAADHSEPPRSDRRPRSWRLPGTHEPRNS